MQASNRRLTAWALTLCLACAGSAAAQTWIDEYEYDFGTTVVDHFSGTDGWVSGYHDDPWTTNGYPGEANPLTDVSGGDWIPSSATTNHLVQEASGPWESVSVRSRVALLDDDAVGLVTRKSGPATFYLFLMTLDAQPPDGAGGSANYGVQGAFLYRVEGGQAVIVASETGPDGHYREDDNNWAYQRMRLDVVDDQVDAYYSADESGSWTNADMVLSYTDPAPLPAGYTGVYSYESGEYSSLVGFNEYRVKLADSDDDGWVDDDDCEPYDDTIHPGAAEVCNGFDDDCDGAVDDLSDNDGDGFSVCDDCDDCDDLDPHTHPGATELCDGLDNDCDGILDLHEADGDGDGFRGCDGDCDDGDPGVYPGASELCDGIDNDCDGILDLQEADGDGDGVRGCEGDCNDADPAIHPGAPEGCDGLDTDCDGAPAPGEVDGDGDGIAPCQGDCDDAEPEAYPGNAEDCLDGIDNDCDGDIDGDDLDCAGDDDDDTGDDDTGDDDTGDDDTGDDDTGDDDTGDDDTGDDDTGDDDTGDDDTGDDDTGDDDTGDDDTGDDDTADDDSGDDDTGDDDTGDDDDFDISAGDCVCSADPARPPWLAGLLLPALLGARLRPRD
jgi:hypothetical protein